MINNLNFTYKQENDMENENIFKYLLCKKIVIKRPL